MSSESDRHKTFTSINDKKIKMDKFLTNMTFEEKAEYKNERDNLIREMIARIVETNRQQNPTFAQLSENGFNESLYEESKPAFIATYNDFKDSITDVQSFATALVKTLHTKFNLPKKPMLMMKPYLSRFITDVSNGILSPSEIPLHLHPMKIEAFRKLTPEQQAKHKQIADELAKRMIQRIAEENMKNSTPTQNNLNMTQESQTLSKEDRLLKLTPEQIAKYRLTPEQIAEADKRMDRTVDAMLKGLAEDNQEIFGTPIPEHLK